MQREKTGVPNKKLEFLIINARLLPGLETGSYPIGGQKVRRGPPAYATGPRGCETPKANLTSACVSPPGRGKKARCSSLTTPLSTRCGRMPRRSG